MDTEKVPSEKALKALDNLIKFCGFNIPGRTKADGVKLLSARVTKAYDGEKGTADEGLMFVEGILAAEQLDFEGEIMDYASSKPLFKAWNANFAELTSGKSVGNLRGQHNSKICSGTFVQMDYDDDKKEIPVIAKVIDPVEQEKVRHGAYTSFSIGARYAKKWRDGKVTRWTADPFEGSLVDFGAVPKTHGISYRAADGTETTIEFDGGRRLLRETFEALGKPLTVEQEDRVIERVGKSAAAQKGLYGISGFATLLQQLIYMRDSFVYERETEGDESPVTDRVMEATEELLECLAAYTQEQVSEEIGKTKSKEEGGKAMELNDLVETARNTPGADPAKKAAAATDDATKDNLVGGDVFKAAVNQLAEGVKQGAKILEMLTAKAAESTKCSKSADDCDDEKCMTHKGKEKAAAAAATDAAKCVKTDCADEACKEHGEAVKAAKATKAAGAGAVTEVALKAADVEAMVEKAVGARVEVATKAAVEAAVEAAVKPLGAQLEAIGDALKALGGAQMPTRISARAGISSVTKDEEEQARQETETAEKSVRDDVTSGKTVSAIMKIRERPQFVTTK